ncbi:Putative teichuronic acid biosynthesis glycosyltransferase TuaC [Maioricimonas rarisocia]|uniref:Teichuronic acid biosynthesis glycosyltransferase TuaC n=1 Tax=Maioricimonas rarisocia TaxID=2528026 RepID=A0A517Z7D2_9PLAN|nr:glycosyltransferase [Maioricimonas rarisocia]QDU38393.1 Putative teichuronic acid biosynthesis glycosyltransferase TuaC [Maioricimonas rarisocia]
MNILFLSTIFPDTSAPVTGPFNAALCRSLAQQHAVRVIAPRNWPDVARSFRSRQRMAPPQDLTDTGVSIDYPTYWYTPGFGRTAYGRFLWHSIRPTIKRVLREFTPDVVLSYWAHPDGEAGLEIARMAGVPCGVIVGGSDVLLLPEDARRAECVRSVLKDSDAVFTVSDHLREVVCQLGGKPEKTHTIRQGIDPKVFRPGDRHAIRARLGEPLDRPLLLWVGRMVDVKNPVMLLQAARRLAEADFAFRLALVGDGPLRAMLEAFVREHDLQDRVRFVGAVAQTELPDWYRAADVTLLSSHSEGLPNVLRESLACGTPFVSTQVGSVPEIAESQVSILVEPGNASALADGVISVLHGRYAEAAERYRPRTWGECADHVAGLLQSLCGNTSPDPMPFAGVGARQLVRQA